MAFLSGFQKQSLQIKSPELTGWLDGVEGERWCENPKKELSAASHAWRQGHFNREPGMQEGADLNFPKDQTYNPPEDELLSVEVLSKTAEERVALHEYRFTKVKVTQRGVNETRDLVALKMNPWWYPHDLYTPLNDGSGGSFTIGRVIHSARIVGFTGWIGGVAVFDRALTAEELKALTVIGKTPVKLKTV